jgi:hypothetical protein
MGPSRTTFPFEANDEKVVHIFSGDLFFIQNDGFCRLEDYSHIDINQQWLSQTLT